MRRSFNLFSASALILLILVVAMVAAPDSRTRLRVANEARAIKALRWIALAEARLLADGGVDRDRNGRPEYGFLEDLLAAPEGGKPRLELEFEGDPAAEFVSVGAYRVAVRLPDRNGLGVGPGGPVHPEYATRSFLAAAWPARFPRDGHGWYAVDRNLLVAERPGREADGVPREINGLHLLVPNPAEGRPTVPSSWPRPWYPLEPKVQAKWLVPRLEADHLPIPESLAIRED